MTPPPSQKTPVWVAAIAVSILLGLVGVVYSDIRTELATKASKEAVQESFSSLREDIKYIKDALKRLENVHIKREK